MLALANAAWHVAVGAREVHLYLDGAERIDAEAFSKIPGCRLTICDDAYWSGEHGTKRPDFHQHRQALNATHALERTRTDYLLHLDADEFLWQREELGRELAGLRRGAFLQIGAVERVWAPGEDRAALFSPTFRVPENLFDPPDLSLTADEDGLTRWGLTGHATGKSVVPRGYGYKMNIHHPSLRGTGGRKPPRTRSVDCSILHFDGITRLEWIYKLIRKAEAISIWPDAPATDTRLRQIAAMLAAGRSETAVNALHDRLKCIDSEKADRLWMTERLVRADLGIAAALDQFLPGGSAQLTAENYDHWLWDRSADLFRAYGLA
jgi:hypothetical protein